MTTTRIDVDRFDGTGDFALWKVRMLAHFGVLGLKDILTDETLLRDSPTTKEELGAAKKDQQKGIAAEASSSIDPVKFEKSEKAKDLIVVNVGNQVLRKISNCETAAAMWTMLDRLYTETSLPNRIYLQLKFYTFKMSDSKNIDANVDDFLKLVTDLNSLGVEVSEEVQSILLLSSLSHNYDQLKETLKYGRDTLRLNEVTAAAKSKERELTESGKLSRSDGEGLIVESRGRSEHRGNSKQWRERSKSRNGRSRSRQRFDKNDTGCFICGSEDHWKRECPERKKRPPNSANIAAEPKQPIVLTVSTQDSMKEWVMDSGCSYHSTPEKEVLFDFKEFDGGRVLMANNTHGNIKGMGKIRIQNPDGSEVILTDVRYIPEVSRNLISYGMLERSGCRYEGRNFKVQFYKGGKKAISGKYKDGLYYLQGTVAKSEENASGVEKEIRQEKSRKVTFCQNLVQGTTPNGYEKKVSLAHGGDSEEVESKERNEKSGQDDHLFEKESSNKELEMKDLEKVSKILGMGIFGDRAKEEEVISKIHANKDQTGFLRKAVPEQELQVCCKLPSLN